LEKERGQWKPFKFEQKFGSRSEPPLELNLNGQKILLHGIIDRLDINSEAKLRVIDYKSGSSHMEKKDLQNGTRLQLPIYALAAERALQLGEVAEGFYWKITQAAASSFNLSSFEFDNQKGPQAAYKIAQTHIQQVLEASRAGNYLPKAPKDGCPDYCPAVQWCWRYHGGYNNA